MEEIFYSFPSDVFLIIVTYLDYGDPLDGTLFDPHHSLGPLLRSFWLRVHNFQVCEQVHQIGGCPMYIITRTIDIGGRQVYHSIEDQPAYIISKLPLNQLGEQKIPKDECDMDDNFNFPILRQDWGSFGLLSRADGLKPACQVSGTNCTNDFFDFYFSHGLPGSSKENRHSNMSLLAPVRRCGMFKSGGATRVPPRKNFTWGKNGVQKTTNILLLM